MTDPSSEQVKRAASVAPKKNPKTGLWEFVVDLGPGPDRNGIWRTRRQAKRRGFPTKREAQEALDEVRVDVRRGTHVSLSSETFEMWLDGWLDGKSLTVKPATASFYRRYAKTHIVPRLGPVPIQQLDAVTLNRLYRDLLDNGRADGNGGLSVATVRHVHTIISAALDDAVKAQRLTANPARGATPPAVRSADRPEMKTWDASTLGRFLDFEAATRYGPPFTFLALTGCRRGEAIGLTWADTDLDAGQVSIRRTITEIDGQIHRSNTTKTGRGRSIRLQPDLVNSMRSWRATQAAERLLLGPDYADEDLVFCHRDGRPYIPDMFSREFDRRVKRHKLPRIRLHDLRHTYATLALQVGVPAKVVSERLGHSSVTVTLDLYSHVMPAVEGEHADAVAKLIGRNRRKLL